MRVIYFLFIFLVVFSCKKDKSAITIGTNDSARGVLRTDGFYYLKKDYATPYVLYSNGTVFYTGTSYDHRELEEFESYIDTVDVRDDNKTLWGAFEILDSAIHFQRLFFLGGLTSSTEDYQRNDFYGIVFNDSTFGLHLAITDEGHTPVHLIDTFHFYPTETKPDSTNVVVP